MLVVLVSRGRLMIWADLGIDNAEEGPGTFSFSFVSDTDHDSARFTDAVLVARYSLPVLRTE